MIWRDDDVGAKTKLHWLAAVDDVFQRYRTPHTIAVMASGLDSRPDLVSLIRERRMIVQLHCWKHDKLAADEAARAQLWDAMDMLADLFGKVPTVLYPPWNETSPELERDAAALGLTVSTSKVSLDQFIRAGGDVRERVVNFHHWDVCEALMLEPALRLAS